ncbi:D-ribose pyranase [Actinotalea sp. M2MS4P-6]|uniref:D-ribose pyranase n=1 Tax=Actinotalea sp. M2MS4P-6 TaxID=2983762 RepID=UPI0021E42F35|nr:D-ribose pyranase [Actinotalea sp. M2MS4P-6]MCV2394214.1 D-ribose pyranase [Actinotalea sp. M2MS4P-6]
MKRHGIINAPLSGHLARLGHTDLVVVADAGLPVPAHLPVVDLALVYGEPRFTTVLDALLAEIVVEHAWVSEPVDDWPAAGWIDERLDSPAERLPHDELKAMVGRAQLVIRTGEDTAYSNVVLRCGVPFAV